MISEYKKNLLHRLKIARGHLDRVIKMVEDEEYCFSIIQQTTAIEKAIRKVSEILLEHHLKTCVRESLKSNRDVDQKVKEVIEVFRKK